MSTITQAAVIGAGTMGCGIAAHLANAGVEVLLLDLASDTEDRNAVVKRALQRMQDSQPPLFMQPADAQRIRLGNIDDDLGLLRDVDWIAEAVVERLAVKQDVYQRIDGVRRRAAIVSSNTSTIPLRLLTQHMSESFKKQFCITHFFNPVRYMQLLELVRGPHTSAVVVDTLTTFCDQMLGKGVVQCNDTPGFLANRVGVYALQVGMCEAINAALSVEEADALMGRPMGIPKTGVFGLYDLIGLDLMLDVSRSLVKMLPADDAFQQVADGIPITAKLVALGRCGNKSGAGFYRSRQDAEGRWLREAIDLGSAQYRPPQRLMLHINADQSLALRALMSGEHRYQRFARRVLAKVLAYAATLIPSVASDPGPIDEAMKLGYSWRYGPFEMIDQLGSEWLCARMQQEGIAIPAYLQQVGARPLYRARDRVQVMNHQQHYVNVPRAPGIVRLADVKKLSKPLLRAAAASLWDCGDGVGCVEFHSKANALGPPSMALLATAIDYASEHFKALLIYNDAPQFSVGFNLDFVLECIRQRQWSQLDKALSEFQNTCRSLRQAPLPVVAAPAGLALGGGFEVVLGTDAVQAHANATMGLVETLVGLLPAGGGCTQMLHRFRVDSPDSATAARAAFALIAPARTANSPQQAYRQRFLLPRDRWTMNRDRLLSEARAVALELCNAYCPPPPLRFDAAGNSGQQAILAQLDEWRQRGLLTPHDGIVGKQLADVLCGGEGTLSGAIVTEDQMLALEREAFIALAHTPATVARIECMLSTGRPLRN